MPSQARVEDSSAIASLLALSWASPFARLQFGRVDPLALTAAMTPRIAQQIAHPNAEFIVLRNPDTQEVVSVAQWSLPSEAADVAEETQEEQDEHQTFEDEWYRSSLPENSNKDLIMDFTVGLRTLKHQVLQGRKHYALDNLATHPDYCGRGFASRLVEWVFPLADADGAVVYLEAAGDNTAIRMYKRLGLEECGRYTLDDLSRYASRQELEEHGVTLEHTHVAFVRRPQRSPGI